MTKQNVAISNVAVSNSPVFVQRPLVAPGSYITVSRKKVLKNLDVNGARRINSWVDSMKASSPTHVKSTPSANLPEDHSSWMVSQVKFLDQSNQIFMAPTLPVILGLIWLFEKN